MLLSAIRNGRRPAELRLAAEEETLVRVRGGYSPDVVHARAGEPIRITFLREETASCSERVVFPAFGKSTMLPRGERIMVELPPSLPGTYEFTCAMDMLHGKLVVG
jgi:plastocyanin domain-containing protein